MLDIDKIKKEAICCSQALLQDYFQKNKIQSDKTFNPIEITNVKTSSGWSQNSTKLGLQRLAELLSSKTITIKEFDNELAPHIQGTLIEKEKSAVIYVNRDLNFCWRRFIVAKELNHLLMNRTKPSLREEDLDTIKELLSNLLTPTEAPSTYPETSEYMAYLGAIELLLPKQFIDNKILSLTDKDLAEKLKIPIRVANVRRSFDDDFTRIYKSFPVELSRMKKLFNQSS